MTARGYVRRASIAALAVATLIGLTACVGETTGRMGEDPGQSIPEDWELSSAQAAAVYESKITQIHDAYGFTDISADLFVRYVSASEIATVMSECAGESGFTVTPNDTGGISIDEAPPGQQRALDRTLATCEAMYPVDPRYDMRLPKARAEKQYAFLTQTVAPCVEDAGYQLTPPPSLQVWLDDYYTTGYAWDPFALASEQMTPDDAATGVADLYRDCPPTSEQVYPPIDLSELG